MSTPAPIPGNVISPPDTSRRGTTASPHLHHSPIERFLLFMSKTDLHALRFCTPETRMTQSSVGAMVAITVVLAFFSSYFAIHSSFFGRAESFFAIGVSFVVAAVYSIAIGAFDREVVAVNNKWAALPRFLLAILIGVVIAYPVELKLLEGRIDAQIVTMVEERNADKAAAATAMERSINVERERLLAPLKVDLKSRQSQVNAALDEYNRERARVACRERCAQRLADLAAARQELEKAESQLPGRTAQIDKEIDQRYSAEHEKIAQIRSEIAREKQTSHDFLSQTLALKEIINATPEVNKLVWFITIFFILLELFPILIKLFLPHSEYTAYIEARRELNKSKIVHIANYKLAEFKAHPENILLNRDEITDSIEGIMEDRNIDVDPDRRETPGPATQQS